MKMAVFTLSCIVLCTVLSSALRTDRSLVYTIDVLDKEKTKLVLDAGDPDVWPRNLANGDISGFEWDWTTTSFRPGSVVVDYNLPHHYFVHDRDIGQIYQFNGESQSLDVVNVYGGSSPQLKDMALDWIGQNIYYTDGNLIGIWSYKNSHYQIIDDERSEPHGIDVDPKNGYLFWAEPRRNRIMKSTLWGTEVSSVVSGVINVQTITVDPDSQMVYWINDYDNSVGTADYDGQQKSLFLGAQSAELAGMEIYKDVMFLMERDSKYTQAYSRSTLIEIERFGFSASGTFRQHGIAMSSPETQPTTQNPCNTNNGGCQHICIPDQNSARCLCQFGYTLNVDQSNCDTEYITDEVLFVVDLEAQKLYQIELVTGEVHDVRVSTAINGPIVVTFDPVEKMVYWADHTVGGNIIIRRKGLTSSTEETFITLGTGQCDGLAIDPIGRNLYYGNDRRHAIIAKSLNTGLETTIVQQNSDVAVTGIQIDTLKGHIYWTNANTASTFLSGTTAIERADLDTGSNKKTIASGSGVGTPYGIALDLPEGKLYWCDFYYSKVERSNLDGTDREEIYTGNSSWASCFGVAVDRDYVYVTDIYAILRIDKATRAVSYLGKQFYWHIVGLASYSSSYMPVNKSHPLFQHETLMSLVVLNVLIVMLVGDD